MHDEENEARALIEKIGELGVDMRLMHVCGTHQDTIVKSGLEELLRSVGIEIIQGPGCPVCVTTPREVEEAIALAKGGKIVTTFGDMVRVPGERDSLLEARAQGHDVRVVYGVEDSQKIAEKEEKEVVFMAIGFETTAPTTAYILSKEMPENFSVLSCHRVIPPAMRALLEMGEVRIDGFIDPGHVSTIIGMKPYEELTDKYKIPQVIAGFEPYDVLLACYMLALQFKNHEFRVENEYKRAVKYEGNRKALDLIERVFKKKDGKWRGFPNIKDSILIPREEEHDARARYEDLLKDVHNKEFKEPLGCRCGEVLRGLINSQNCPLFGKACRPDRPVGPCMVSREGSCNISFRHGSP